MAVEPSWLDEVIWFTPAMRPNCRSSGVATADAMVCGSAPGRPAPTLMTGKSTLRQRSHRQVIEGKNPREQQRRCQQRRANRSPDKWSRNTHRNESKKARMPEVNKQRSRTFAFGYFFLLTFPLIPGIFLWNRIADLVFLKPVRQPVKPQINHRRGVEREQLAENQAAHDGDAERPAQLRSGA